MSLSFTQSDLDALKKALLTGATSVQIGDRQVTYRSQKDLIEAIRLVESFVSGTQQTATSIVKASYSDGYGE